MLTDAENEYFRHYRTELLSMRLANFVLAHTSFLEEVGVVRESMAGSPDSNLYK